jgi:hypothetical protein
MQEEPSTSKLGEEFENPPVGIKMFRTSQCSRYAYFDNGKTQRYKEFDKEYREPQDILVFIPNFEWFSKNAPAEMRGKFSDEKKYDAFINLHIYSRGVRTKILDSKGFEMTKNEDLKKPGLVFLAFIAKEGEQKGKVLFHLPVAKSPKIGFNTFDMRLEEVDSQQTLIHMHLGNTVVEVTRGEPLPASEIMSARKRNPNEVS